MAEARDKIKGADAVGAPPAKSARCQHHVVGFGRCIKPNGHPGVHIAKAKTRKKKKRKSSDDEDDDSDDEDESDEDDDERDEDD